MYNFFKKKKKKKKKKKVLTNSLELTTCSGEIL